MDILIATQIELAGRCCLLALRAFIIILTTSMFNMTERKKEQRDFNGLYKTEFMYIKT